MTTLKEQLEAEAWQQDFDPVKLDTRGELERKFAHLCTEAQFENLVKEVCYFETIAYRHGIIKGALSPALINRVCDLAREMDIRNVDDWDFDHTTTEIAEIIRKEIGG